MTLTKNKLTSLDLGGYRLPILTTLNLDENRMSSLDLGHGRRPNGSLMELKIINLENNDFKEVNHIFFFTTQI